MKKSELKSLIKEVVQQVLSEEKYTWKDGTVLVVGDDNKISNAIYQGKELDVSNWKYFDNVSMDDTYEKNIEPKIQGKKLYRIQLDYKHKHMYICPEAGIVYTTDTTD